MFSFNKTKRKLHDKPTSLENIGPGTYGYLPIITIEGPKYTMKNSNYNLHVSSNDFVPGPKYSFSNKLFRKPLYCK